MSYWFINGDSALLPQDLLQGSEAVDHHHGVGVPQQAVQLVHHRRVWLNSIKKASAEAKG